MNTIDTLLGRGERVRYIGRQHVFVLIGNVLTELLLIGVLIAAGVVSQVAFPDKVLAGMEVGVLVLMVCVIISILVLGSAFLDYLRWSKEQCVVTDMRVILLRGMFNIKAIDIPVEKINEVELHQSWIGRLLNFGDIVIITASEAGVSQCRSLADPQGFKRALDDARYHIERNYAYIESHDIDAYLDLDDALLDEVEVDRVSHALQHLVDMRRRGLISREEFEARKRELLSRL